MGKYTVVSLFVAPTLIIAPPFFYTSMSNCTKNKDLLAMTANVNRQDSHVSVNTVFNSANI